MAMGYFIEDVEEGRAQEIWRHVVKLGEGHVTLLAAISRVQGGAPFRASVTAEDFEGGGFTVMQSDLLESFPAAIEWCNARRPTEDGAQRAFAHFGCLYAISGKQAEHDAFVAEMAKHFHAVHYGTSAVAFFKDADSAMRFADGNMGLYRAPGSEVG